MLLADIVEVRYVYRNLIGTRDGMEAMNGPIDRAYFDSLYEMPDEAEAQYQLCRSRIGGM
jgi:hypothetical protein